MCFIASSSSCKTLSVGVKKNTMHLYFCKFRFKPMQLFPQKKKKSLPRQMHIVNTRLPASTGSHTHTHSPVRVQTRHKNFPDKTFGEPSSSLQTVGILTSWHFLPQKRLIRSFLTSSAAVCHLLCAPLQRGISRARGKLPKSSPMLPRQKSELLMSNSKNVPILKKDSSAVGAAFM